MANEIISAERLRELLNYDPETGLFVWRRDKGRAKAGNQAGYICQGYVIIGLHGGIYKAHRLAWLYVTGEFPAQMIDHINGIRSDNRFANLREATPGENRQNVRNLYRNNKSGIVGVSWCAITKKWRAQIQFKGVKTSLGGFETIEEAQAAYVEAKRAMHPFGTL